MPTGNDRRFQRALDTIERIRAKGSDNGKGKGQSLSDASSNEAWNCRECNYFNFGSRRRCRLCPTARPTAALAPSSSSHSLAKGGGGGKGSGQKGGRGDQGGEAHGSGRLQAQIKQLEEQNKVLRASLAEKSGKSQDKEDEDIELLEEEDEDEGTAAADVENLPALQKCYDSALVQLGADDALAKALRERLDAARAKQRAGKPILQQVQVAQRKASRNERQLEAAKTRLLELETKRDELDKQVTEQAAKVASCTEEVATSRKELGDLLERAKAEKGTAAPASTATPTAGGAAAGPSGNQDAATAWNLAKMAIQQQVAALPSDVSPELQQAIAAQYAAMEMLLNKLPLQGAGNSQAAGATTTAAAAACGSGPPNDGAINPSPPPRQDTDDRQGAPTDADGDDDATGMLDVDESVLAKLAEIFTAGDDDGDEADGAGTSPGGGAGGEDNGDNGSRKSRKLLDSRVTAARRFLAGTTPLRKPQLKNKGTTKG